MPQCLEALQNEFSRADDGLVLSGVADMSTSTTTNAPALVHRRADALFVGGVAIALWTLYGKLPGFDRPLLHAVGPLLGAGLVLVSATHFGASYHLAYRDGWSALRRHPVALVAIPALLLTACAGIVVLHVGGANATADASVRILLDIVFSLTAWHYIKQAFGVVMLLLRLDGMRATTAEVRVLRYGLHPVWFSALLSVWNSGGRITIADYRTGFTVFPSWTYDATRTLSVLTALCAFMTLDRIARRHNRRVRAAMWMPYAAAVLWFVWPPASVGIVPVSIAAHALQYLPCVHRAEMSQARRNGETKLATRWFAVFGTAAAVGLLLAHWLPDVFERAASGISMPHVATALTFSVLNLHHYAMDAVIWRSGEAPVRAIFEQQAAVFARELDPVRRRAATLSTGS
jgi:hypothetical protein